ncbi:hypothetical protein [Leifsonia sp. Leaf264]|uniref:hypothetical protein n=1 Tax=Leifsonia sp. Leaf264 TaxID=1736314 RepID=UPI0006F8AA2E|nr:hypothetical protein [Leifsonia sp. Leaf264]KQO98887.1 hypothetical protein ASF30_12560 [Leifsonia sp. Leaf264]
METNSYARYLDENLNVDTLDILGLAGLSFPQGFDVSKGSEFHEKVYRLAITLASLVGVDLLEANDWTDPHQSNYTADAVETIVNLPHLLSFAERQRLAPFIPQLRP